MNDIKALIFDLDGVIVDSEPIHEKAEMETLREFGMIVPKKEWDGFRGKKIEEIFAYASRAYGNGNEPIEKMIERKINVYLDYALRDMKLVDGAFDFLQELKKNEKYRYALTTSGRKIQQEKILAKFGLDGYFQIMVTAEDVNNGKPHPEPYTVTVEKLDERPERCLVIEDSDNGIMSAKAAGCRSCGITTSFPQSRLESVGADIVVKDFFELSRLLFA